MAGRGEFEPPLRGPEPRVLPLDDLPTFSRFYAGALAAVKARFTSIHEQVGCRRGGGLEDGALERAAGLEARHTAGRDLDGLAGAGIAAVAPCTRAHHEGAEAPER